MRLKEVHLCVSDCWNRLLNTIGRFMTLFPGFALDFFYYHTSVILVCIITLF